MKNLTWPQVVVIVAFLAVIGGLTWTGRDTAVLVTVGMAMLAGLGLSIGQGQAIKDQTNGNTGQLLEMQREMMRTLAQTQPATPAAAAPAAESTGPVVSPPDRAT